jgi:hypothetical protein
MDYAACCPELKNLIAKPDKGTGLGLMIVTAKHSTQSYDDLALRNETAVLWCPIYARGKIWPSA